LPESVVEAVGATEYYDVACENGRIVLTPVHPDGAADVRRRLAERGITEADVTDAMAWARQD
jgi:hypothetical protein